MGFLFGKRGKAAPQQRTPPRGLPPFRPGKIPVVTADRALQNSAVWAALRLRADTISTLPIDCYKRQPGSAIQIPVPTPAVLVSPGGDRCDITEWLYSSQVELDRSGNAIGIISARDSAGFPSRIDLVPSAAVSVRVSGYDISEYRISGKSYSPDVVWHERQYTLAGCHVGLSPVAYAALTLGEWISVQQFVTNWYGGNAVPRARLRNAEREIDGADAALVKEAWRASIAMGEPFVHGSDWEYSLMQAESASRDWIESKRYGVLDIARFFNVPAELIDASVADGASETYASLVNRMLEFLVLHLGPSIVRRERALSRLLPRPRFVKLNGDALLRMDPQTRADMLRTRLESRQLVVSEARALENLPPLTAEQQAEADHFFPPRAA